MEPMKPVSPMKPMKPMKPMEPMKPPQQWWPNDLGEPSASGGQNDMRYAYFAGHRRLAVQDGGTAKLFDTGDHQISGVAQQGQNGGAATFTSQKGSVRLDELKVVKQ